MDTVILLTERAPVSIEDADWTIVLCHEKTRVNSQMEPVVTSRVTVRRNSDGAHLVYGEGPICKGGYLLAPGESVEHKITLLCIVIGADTSGSFARDCIQHLPAERI